MQCGNLRVDLLKDKSKFRIQSVGYLYSLLDYIFDAVEKAFAACSCLRSTVLYSLFYVILIVLQNLIIMMLITRCKLNQ